MKPTDVVMNIIILLLLIVLFFVGAWQFIFSPVLGESLGALVFMLIDAYLICALMMIIMDDKEIES